MRLKVSRELMFTAGEKFERLCRAFLFFVFFDRPALAMSAEAVFCRIELCIGEWLHLLA